MDVFYFDRKNAGRDDFNEQTAHRTPSKVEVEIHNKHMSPASYGLVHFIQFHNFC